MISSKEKAKELIAKFTPHVQYWDCYNDEPIDENHAKQCALICVEEIIAEIKNLEMTLMLSFWEDVRTEILNFEEE